MKSGGLEFFSGWPWGEQSLSAPSVMSVGQCDSNIIPTLNLPPLQAIVSSCLMMK